MKTKLLGVDTGGTFTDFVCISEEGLRVHKALSTPKAPQDAILLGIDKMQLTSDMADGDLIIVHGTTVATNATLEGKGVRTVYITNRGLKDVLKIGRQTRNQLYNLKPVVTPDRFDSELMLEVSARVDANGREISDFGADELTTLKSRVKQLGAQSVAINLLFSFLSSKHEEQLEDLFMGDYFVSRSSSILPEYREYERGITTWLNAWIGPIISDYMKSLINEVAPTPLAMIQSSGLTIDASQAANRAVNLLLSGPAGGLAAAQHLGKHLQKRNLITFDMGGTSTDVALIEERFKLTNNGHVGGYPVGVPMADIHTIGAGGGSIAYVDEGGLLQVGPQSAGANPGPACYGPGGTKATVTDANLILGRLGPKPTLAGDLKLDQRKAESAMQEIADQTGSNIQEAAEGIIRLANEHMSQALRVISIHRGHDPRQFTLICFGGAGGLHLCDLAESLEMQSAVVPIHAGVLSALGMLTTKPGRELVKTYQHLLMKVDDEMLSRLFADMESQALDELAKENVSRTLQIRSLDLRYQGQTYTINIAYDDDRSACEARFHEAHEQQYGHRLELPVELVNYRMHIEAEQDDVMLPPWQTLEISKQTEYDEAGMQLISRPGLRVGQLFQGPALVIEDHATTYIKEGWHVTVDEIGNLLLSQVAGS